MHKVTNSQEVKAFVNQVQEDFSSRMRDFGKQVQNLYLQSDTTDTTTLKDKYKATSIKPWMIAAGVVALGGATVVGILSLKVLIVAAPVLLGAGFVIAGVGVAKKLRAYDQWQHALPKNERHVHMPVDGWAVAHEVLDDVVKLSFPIGRCI